MCAVWFWRWCVQGKRRVLHNQGGGEDQGQGSCFLLQPQVQEVALPLLHHQAKAQGWPLRSPSVSCRGCSDPRGGLHDQGQHAALAKALTPVWCDDVLQWSHMLFQCCFTDQTCCFSVASLITSVLLHWSHMLLVSCLLIKSNACFFPPANYLCMFV